MRIGALAPWYGSKRTIARDIIRQLGPHSCYWEPFCGSCAVLLAKPQVTYESVNDLHQDLCNLALVLRDENKAIDLYGRIQRTLFHESLCQSSRENLQDACVPVGNVERAYWYLVFSWLHLNGVAGTPMSSAGTFCVRYSAKGGSGATRWRSVAESIPDWHQRLQGVQILCRDAFEILARLDDANGTAIYVDPPYLSKGTKYVYDFEAEDHVRLAGLLKRFRKARVVVSYYDHPQLAELYPDWCRQEISVAKGMVQSARRDQSGRVAAPEVLLVNGPLVTEALFA